MSRFVKLAYVFAVYLFLYTPIIILIAYSFNDSSYSLLWHGFTFKWYHALVENYDLQIVALRSLLVGISAATLATLLGTLTAVSLYRYRFGGKKLFHSLIFILILSPDIVTGISLLIMYAALKIPLGFWTLLLAHITFCLPFVSVTVYSRLIGQDKNIFEAAKDLGASEWIIFRRLFVPLLGPAIAAGWLLSFTLSLDDVIISYFVTGPEFEILPLKIFAFTRLGVKPEINALCSVMFGLTLAIVLVYQLASKKKQGVLT